MRHTELDRADLVEAAELIVVEIDIERDEIVRELLGRARADQRRDHCRMTHRPGKRDLGRGAPQLVGNLRHDIIRHDPKRPISVGACVTDDVPAAVKELERIAKLGMRGVMLPVTLAEGDSYADRKLDPVWAAIEETGLVVSLHAGTSRAGINPKPADWPQLYAGVHYLIQRVLTDTIFGGVFDRFPKLRIVSVENDVSWLPHYAYRMDHFAEHFVAHAKLDKVRKPSELIRKHFFSTFQFEGPGIDTVRKLMGSETIMWGNDFPISIRPGRIRGRSSRTR